MKILLMNAPDALNYGSMMLAENFLYYAAKHRSPERVECVIVTHKGDETSARLSQALEGYVDNLSLHTIHPGVLVQGRKVVRLLAEATGWHFNERLSPASRGVDVVVVLGGDDFTEDYGYLYPMRQLLRLHAFARSGVRVVMLGQSIGPFHAWRKLTARHLLNAIHSIVAREPIAYQYLVNDLRLSNVSMAADLAFLPLAGEADCDAPRVARPYFTIVPSGIIWRYAMERDRNAYVNTLASICMEWLRQLPELRMLVLPHVVNGDPGDDRLVARELLAVLEARRAPVHRVVYIDDILLPRQARRLLGQSEWVFTGRMHAAISALTQGVPALSLAYSQKYRGIIGECLGLHDAVIDVRRCAWHDIEKEVIARLQLLGTDWAQLKEEVMRRVAVMRQEALKSIRSTVAMQ